MKEPLLQTAYHEAGHAVAAYRLGLIVDTTTVVPNKENGTLGTSRSEDFGGREDIIVLFAGFEAERRYNPKADKGCSCGDDTRAEDILSLHPDWTEAELRSEAAQLVESQWREISAVAEALAEFRILNGDEATIICDAFDENLDWRAVLQEYRL